MEQQRPVSTYQPSLSHDGPEVFVQDGHRAFFDVRDLGIDTATNGDYGMKLVHARDREQMTTGWHYHTCELQVVVCLRGWEDLALEDGRLVRIVPGSCLNIPPGFAHNEIGYSDDFEVMVITKPAKIGTTSIERPPNAPDGT